MGHKLLALVEIIWHVDAISAMYLSSVMIVYRQFVL